MVRVTHVFITVTFALHDHHKPPTPKVLSVYVVVDVGYTEIAVLLRFGYTKFNPIIFGVIVASVALVYDAFNIAACHGMISGVVVVNEQVEGTLFTT